MKVALGRLAWPPAVFWAATPQEFWAAFEDWRDLNCPRPGDHPWTAQQIATIEAMKRRFPDAGAG